ncbi:hypothetical protein [uncultured Ilyobacter sp.]|uniref:hypothetical protein n=1 Tax=uncultured Ilyobacter sp. TaxID=544433 RepID=UPI0029C984DA|nr:hypothetical protein [uncultured Ilyobacter sp.]
MAVSKICFSKECSLHSESVLCLTLDNFIDYKIQMTVYGVTVYRKNDVRYACRNTG